MREMPGDSDVYRYDPDLLWNGSGQDAPKLREVLTYACCMGKDGALFSENAEQYAGICDRVGTLLDQGGPFELSVADGRLMSAAAQEVLQYALDNNYDDPAEDDQEAKRFAVHGRMMLHTLTFPWAWLELPDDGTSGFTRVT